MPYEPVFPNLTFDSPLTFNEVPNANKIIIGQRDGQIFWFDKIPNVSTKNVMLDLSNKVGVVWDGGFLGLALHPQFGTPGKNYFYTWYTTKDANGANVPNFYTSQSCDLEEYWGNFLVLARYEADPITLAVQESSEQTLLKLRMYGTTHRGGGLVFGDDGFLYLTTGDQTAYKKAQDITNNLDGGVLRIDVNQDNTKSHIPIRTMPDDHGFPDEITGNGYWIPNDNPFLSPTGENFEEYYSLGHRNPHRMTKDRATGELYVGEIGGSRHEEINIIKRGKNYGWPLYEGLYVNTSCVPELLNGMDHESPLTAFPRTDANAVIGGYVYRGTEVPELQGKYICADYGNGEEIWSVNVTTGDYTQLGSFTSTNIISFGEDEQSELYIMKQGVSTLFKMIPADDLISTMPRFLSETGAFQDLTTLEPTDGLIPYELVESFWSDGALKKRWLGIPNDGNHDTAVEQIDYSENGVWNFPVGSVLIKHFELPIDENNPSVTKRLETRFSIKAANGEFYFTTYKWNDEQTDAEILTDGLNETIPISKVDGSIENQVWQYPSNGQCFSCHNPSSGGTLGTRTRYLNKDFTYPKTGRTANQLVTLSHLGILDQSITDADTGFLLTSKSINDPVASIDEKARSYMDLNCAYCHRPGTGNRGDFDLRLNLDLVQTGLLTAAPYESLGIPNEKIVDPGNPDTSILYHRLGSVENGITMPPLAKNKVDAQAVQLIDAWISRLSPDEPCTDHVILEIYDNVGGQDIDVLKNDPNFPDNPSSVDELIEFDIPRNTGNNYGARVKGLLKAPETGTYYFWVSGDGSVELNVSLDDDEVNKIRVAYHDSWSNYTEWNKFPTQKSIGVDLVAGQNYYIEALMNEGGGGDHLSVGWRKPSNGNGTLPFQIIPCSVFEIFAEPPVQVTGVELDSNVLDLEIDEMATLLSTISPEDADDQVVVWSSSDTLVASVDENGLVTAIAAGTATITITTNDGGFTAESLVTVSAPIIPATGITLNPIALSLEVGETIALIETVLPEDASDKSVSWLSSDSDIVTVNTSGLVTAVGEGIATIVSTTNDGGFTAEAMVTVSTPVNPVTGITLDVTTFSLEEGQTQLLIASIVPVDADDQAVVWSSNNPLVATVDPAGLVSAIAEGTATITTTTNDGGLTAESVVTVSNQIIPVTGVGMNLASATLVENAVLQLIATISPADASNTTVSWSSSDGAVAIVDENGLVTAVSEGIATISVITNDGGFTAESVITVSAVSIPVTGITLDLPSISLEEGQTQLLSVSIVPVDADDQTVAWSSSVP